MVLWTTRWAQSKFAKPYAVDKHRKQNSKPHKLFCMIVLAFLELFISSAAQVILFLSAANVRVAGTTPESDSMENVGMSR